MFSYPGLFTGIPHFKSRVIEVSRNPSFAQPIAIADAVLDHFGACSFNQLRHSSCIFEAKKNKFFVLRISIFVEPEIVDRGFFNSVAS